MIVDLRSILKIFNIDEPTRILLVFGLAFIFYMILKILKKFIWRSDSRRIAERGMNMSELRIFFISAIFIGIGLVLYIKIDRELKDIKELVSDSLKFNRTSVNNQNRLFRKITNGEVKVEDLLKEE